MKLIFKRIPLLEPIYFKILFWNVTIGRKVSKEQFEFNEKAMEKWKELEKKKMPKEYIDEFRFSVAECYGRMSQSYVIGFYITPYAEVIDFDNSII